MTERKTPTTERVRDFYRGATGWRWEDGDDHTDLSGLRASLADEFDRWLAEHDAKVRAEVQEATIQADADTLAAEIHEAWEFQYDECDHGTYSGGHLNGEPYEMCRLSAERIVRRRAADRIEREAGLK